MRRSGTETRRRNHQVNVRLTSEEWRDVIAVADALNVSPGEVFRRAYLAVKDQVAGGDDYGCVGCIRDGEDHTCGFLGLPWSDGDRS